MQQEQVLFLVFDQQCQLRPTAIDMCKLLVDHRSNRPRQLLLHSLIVAAVVLLPAACLMVALLLQLKMSKEVSALK